MTPAAALALDYVPVMHVASELLGPLTVATEEVFAFPDGLYGFPDCRRFVLVQSGRDGVYWLQSVEHATLSFLLVDPFRAVPDYEVELGAADREAIAVEDPADVALLSIVTLPRTRAERPTTNLQAPLALNLRARRGRQVVFPEQEGMLRRAFDLDLL